MRVFYLFHINDNFYSLYKDIPSSLFNILKQVHRIAPSDIDYAMNIFYQVNTDVPKEELDRKLFLELHQETTYKKEKDIHFYNNMYFNEESIMEIRHNYIKIKTNKDLSYFLKVLVSYQLNYFVCDFKNQDYFFLNGIQAYIR